MTPADQVLRIIAEQIDPLEETRLDSDFRSLGADDLDMLEIVFVVGDVFDVEISDSEAEAFKTPADIIALISAKLGVDAPVGAV
jgi:acyl carrier protein